MKSFQQTKSEALTPTMFSTSESTELRSVHYVNASTTPISVNNAATPPTSSTGGHGGSQTIGNSSSRKVTRYQFDPATNLWSEISSSSHSSASTVSQQNATVDLQPLINYLTSLLLGDDKKHSDRGVKVDPSIGGEEDVGAPPSAVTATPSLRGDDLDHPKHRDRDHERGPRTTIDEAPAAPSAPDVETPPSPAPVPAPESPDDKDKVEELPAAPAPKPVAPAPPARILSGRQEEANSAPIELPNQILPSAYRGSSYMRIHDGPARFEEVRETRKAVQSANDGIRRMKQIQLAISELEKLIGELIKAESTGEKDPNREAVLNERIERIDELLKEYVSVRDDVYNTLRDVPAYELRRLVESLFSVPALPIRYAAILGKEYLPKREDLEHITDRLGLHQR